MWLLKMTPSSVILLMSASEKTWNPPQSVRIGPGQLAEPVQVAEVAHDLLARAEHQVIGVAEDDLRAGGGEIVGRTPLTVPCVPTGMNAGVSNAPWRVVTWPSRASVDGSFASRSKTRGGPADISRSVFAAERCVL